MTQRPRTSTSTPPSSYNHPWSHPANAASDPALALGLGRPQAPRSHSDRFGISPRRPAHPTHYPPSPAMLSLEPASGPSTPKTALKVFTSVKRSFSSAVAKKPGPSASFTNSTVEETYAAQIRITAVPASSKPPPTVQQIAAGLVLPQTSRYPARAPLNRRTTSPMPPPPARSSLKKPLDSSASSSSSTSLASTSLMSTRTGSTTTAATSIASSRKHRARFSIKDALFRRSASASPTPITPNVPKAVRFHEDRLPPVEPTSLPPT